MYNRYIGKGFDDLLPPEAFEAEEIDGGESFEIVSEASAQPSKGRAAAQNNPLSGILGGLKLPELSADTLILLALVCFLVYEEGDSMSDTMLLIGVLLLLGF